MSIAIEVSALSLMKLAFYGFKVVKELRNKKDASGKVIKGIEKSPIVVMEIGRAIEDDVREFLGEPSAVISLKRRITADEVDTIARDVYRALKVISREARKKRLLYHEVPFKIYDYTSEDEEGITHAPLIWIDPNPEGDDVFSLVIY